jgi:hypothetical protein
MLIAGRTHYHYYFKIADAGLNSMQAFLNPSWWKLLKFPINLILRTLYDPGIQSASNRNQYQGYHMRGTGGRSVELKTLPLSFTDGLEILGFSTS